MSPQETRRTNHWDAALSMVGIGALTFLSYVRPDWDSRWVIGAICMLSVRSTALLMHAAKLKSKAANGVIE